MSVALTLYVALTAALAVYALDRLWLVGNKIRNPEEIRLIEANLPELPLLGWLSMDEGVREADRLGTAVYDQAPSLRSTADEIGARLLPVAEAR